MDKYNRLWELAIAKLHNEASVNELAELDKLLEDRNNQKVYHEITSLYGDVAKAKEIRKFSENRSWETVSKQIRGKAIKMLWSFSKYAALIIVAFLLGTLITNQYNKRSELVRFAEVSVPLGQMSEITLYDGTKVWLNSGTTIRYQSNFGKNNRNVALEGEAFFEVTKSKLPFKVELKDVEVEVLGTTFNVVSYSDEDYSQVTLVEGKVKVNDLNENSIAVLKPSEQIYIDSKTNKASISKVETNFYTSWINGKIVFDDQPLAEITRKLERWYNVDIQFKEPGIGELHFSGTILKHKPFNQIVTAFGLLLPVDINYTHINNGKDKIVFSKKRMPM